MAATEMGSRDILPRLADLKLRITFLEKEHKTMQQQYKTKYAEHGNNCAASLRSSLEGLFEIIVLVRKKYKHLIDWHHRSAAVKSALRVVGVDRRTHVIIEKGTHQLQSRVQSVEQDFEKTGKTFDRGLQEARRLKSGLLDFSAGQIDEVSHETNVARDEAEEEYDKADAILNVQMMEQEEAQEKSKELSASVNQAKEVRETAEKSRDAWSAYTVMGVGAAVVSAVAFPPSFLYTGSLVVASALAGKAAVSYSGHASDLVQQEQSLTDKQAQHEASVKELEASVAQCSIERDECSQATKQLEEFQSRNEKFRIETQESLNELVIVQTILNKTRSKISAITRDLHECRYEETRRGIATRLRDVLKSIQEVPAKVKSVKGIDIDHAVRELVEIDNRTNEVLRIAQYSATQNTT